VFPLQTQQLFYDPSTGTYYYYNYDTGEYVFHSQVNLQVMLALYLQILFL